MVRMHNELQGDHARRWQTAKQPGSGTQRQSDLQARLAMPWRMNTSDQSWKPRRSGSATARTRIATVRAFTSGSTCARKISKDAHLEQMIALNLSRRCRQVKDLIQGGRGQQPAWRIGIEISSVVVQTAGALCVTLHEELAEMKETPSSPIRPEQFIQKDSAAAAHDHAISIPWGPDARLELDLPAVMKHSRVDTFWPDLEGSMADYPAALEGRWIPSSKHRHWSNS